MDLFENAVVEDAIVELVTAGIALANTRLTDTEARIAAVKRYSLAKEVLVQLWK